MDTGVDTSNLLARLTMSHSVLCEINKESNMFKAELNSELLNLERKNWCLTMLISKLQGYLLPETTLLVLAARVGREATPAIQRYRLELQHCNTVARKDFKKMKHFMESGFVKMLQTKTNEERLAFEKEMEQAIKLAKAEKEVFEGLKDMWDDYTKSLRLDSHLDNYIQQCEDRLQSLA